jgi:alkylated DNA nucleotide flippase Atl1
VQAYLDSAEFAGLAKEDRLAALVNEILKLELPLESENLGHVFSALPQQLSAYRVKGDIQFVNLPLKVFEQARAAIAEARVQAYLDSAEFAGLAKEDRLAALVNEILKLGLPLESENLGHVFSALPQKLSAHRVKGEIQFVSLSLKVFEQARAAIADARVQAYLDSAEFAGLAKEDRLAALVNEILKLELPLESENLGQVFRALPQKLSAYRVKGEIQFVSLSLKAFKQVRAFIDDPSYRPLIAELREKGLFGIVLLEAMFQLEWPITRMGTMRTICSALPTALKRIKLPPIKIEHWDNVEEGEGAGRIPDIKSEGDFEALDLLQLDAVIDGLMGLLGRKDLVSAIVHAADLDEHLGKYELPSIDPSLLPELLEEAQGIIREAVENKDPRIRAIQDLLSFEEPAPQEKDLRHAA